MPLFLIFRFSVFNLHFNILYLFPSFLLNFKETLSSSYYLDYEYNLVKKYY